MSSFVQRKFSADRGRKEQLEGRRPRVLLALPSQSLKLSTSLELRICRHLPKPLLVAAVRCPVYTVRQEMLWDGNTTTTKKNTSYSLQTDVTRERHFHFGDISNREGFSLSFVSHPNH